MKRYQPMWSILVMGDFDDGEFVRFADHEAEVQHLNARIAELEAENNAMRVWVDGTRNKNTELEAANAFLRETLDPIVIVAGEQPVPEVIAAMIRDHRAMNYLRRLHRIAAGHEDPDHRCGGTERG